MTYPWQTMRIYWRRLRTLTIGGILAATTASCASAPLQMFRSQPNFDRAILAIQIEPTTEPGQYAVSGVADLPRGVELTVMAIRYLHLNQSPLKAGDPQPTYSILAYDTVEVDGDRWETQLSLWKVAPDGAFKETWQLHEPNLKLAVEPDDDVIFLATLSPLDDLEIIERQLARDNRRFASRFIQTTAEGSRYLQAGQSLTIELPTGATIPTEPLPEDLNGGWGNRYLPLPDLPNTRQLDFPEQRQTNAPVSRGELLY